MADDMTVLVAHCRFQPHVHLTIPDCMTLMDILRLSRRDLHVMPIRDSGWCLNALRVFESMRGGKSRGGTKSAMDLALEVDAAVNVIINACENAPSDDVRKDIMAKVSNLYKHICKKD